MPNQFSGSTFANVYKDDFADSAGYHKILFNSGRPLQARELTQLQTILQEQITRFAQNIFLDGAAISPKSSGAQTSIQDYVIVEEFGSNTVDQLIGAEFTGPVSASSSGLKFVVTFAEPASNGDYPILYGRYTTANQSTVNTDVQTTTPTFAEGDTLTAPGGLDNMIVRTKTVSEPESTGQGTLFSMQQAEFFTQGHFVFAPKQTIVISKHSNRADAEVGFEVIQDIVTTDDDEALFDNQGARPNLSSPGADRYRIRLVLTTKSSIADELDFVSFATVRESKIIQIKEGTDSFNQIEKRMAERQFDTTGDFVVNDFEINFEEKDSATITAIIPATQLGNKPTAFLDGYRLELPLDKFIDISKPVSFFGDSGVSTTVSFKNYVSIPHLTGDSSVGVFNPETADWNQLREQNLYDGSNNKRGTARIRSFRSTGAVNDSDGYRAHLIDVQMDAGQNFRDIKKIGRTVSGAMEIDQEDGQTFLVQPEVSTALFEIPGFRVKSTSSVRFSVQRLTTATQTSGEIQVNINANEQFTDEGQWVFINKTQNFVDTVPVTDISVVGTTATCTVNGTDGNEYAVYYYVDKLTPSPISKTYRQGWFDFSRTSQDSDFFVSGQIFDGIELLEAYAGDSNGSDILGALTFDGGQRDNYLGPVSLIDAGIKGTTTNVRAKVAYFEHGSSGDFFSVESYDLADSTWFDYGDIPTYVSKTNGRSYELTNHFDFRQKLDPASSTQVASNHIELPRDGEQIIANVEYYNSRIDQIILGYSKDTFLPIIYSKSGEESTAPTFPSISSGEMILYTVLLNGNTKDVSDMSINKSEYPRFTMEEIGSLQNRVAELEETVSLSFLEQEASGLVELDANGNVRSKTGFFVDDFTKGMAFASSPISENYIDDQFFITQTLDEDNTQVLPKHAQQFTELNFDSDDQYSARGAGARSNVVVKGDQLMLEYISTIDPTLSQTLISWKSSGSSEEHGYYNVNPFNVFSGEGVMRLRPSRDFWFDNVRLPDRNLRGATVRINRNPITNFTPRTTTAVRTWTRTTRRETRRGGVNWNGFIINRRRGIETTTTTFRATQTTTTRVRNRVVSDRSVTRNLGDRTVRVQGVPFLRNRRVLGKAEGLRPETRYWLYFGDVRMDQWTLSRTESQHEADVASGVQRRSYGYSNTSLKRHPLTSGSTSNVLLSDANGDLYFDLWIPNTARIPVPKSRVFDYSAELRRWISFVKTGVKNHGQNSPLVYDYAGWKFRSGTQSVKLLDISSNNEEDASSRARSTFSGGGTVRYQQRSFLTFRQIITEDFIDRSVSPETITSQTGPTFWRPIDPLAQTFTVDATAGTSGVFVTKIDVFIRNAPSASDVQVPLQLQVREVVNGTPVRDAISEQHRKYLPASEVRSAISGMNKTNYESVLAHPVTFEFDEPFFLRAGEEYAIVLLAECDDYEAYVASTYDLILGKTDKRVSKQPSTGSLFLSQNGSTWTPKQNQDMAYRIHTAKFKSSGVANFYPSELPRFRHNYSTSLSVDSADKTKFRVTHLNHNLGVGDKVRLTGLDSAATYLGVASSLLMDPTNVVVSADVNGYEVKNTGAANDFAFTSAGFFGADSVQTNQGFNIDRLILDVGEAQLPQTQVNWTGSFVSGVSHNQIATTGTNDPRFNIDDGSVQGTNAQGKTLLTNGEELFFYSPKYFANEDQVDSALSGVPSMIFGAELSTEQSSLFGGSVARSNIATYPSDVSPIIDLQGGGVTLVNFVCDNQAVDSDSFSSLVNNRPEDYVPETHPTLGTAPSKHITKVVTLQQAANGIRVFLEMHKPAEADFELYYRTSRDVDEDIYTVPFTRVTAQNSPEDQVYVPNSTSDLTFVDYKYLIGGEEGDLDDFISFQLKVVFKTTNTCIVPVMRSIRAIAVI